MSTVDTARLQEILEAARTREPNFQTDSLIVQAHLSQMRLFCLKQGIEFYCAQDSFGSRRDFLSRVVEYNQLPSRLEGMLDSFLIDGRGLVYFRPSKELYRLHYFRPNQYRTYYDDDGELENLILVYSFKVKPARGFASGLSQPDSSNRYGFGGSNAEMRWVRLDVRRDRIEQRITTQKPEFDQIPTGEVKEMVNTLAFIPAVEVFNNRSLTEGEGYSEFGWLAGPILKHDRMVRSIDRNLEFFGSPTLVSSRPKHDLLESDSDGQQAFRSTISSNSGFTNPARPSTRVSEPLGNSGSGAGLRVPRVIANVEAVDRVGYIAPDAVGSDQTAFATMYQEQIRTALGGVDDLSINSGATAYEVRTLYGRVAATAKRKCRDLFEYGICKLFQLMIANEETLFRESFAVAVGLNKPEPPIVEQLPPEQAPKIVEAYQSALGGWNMALQEALDVARETGEVPPNVVGLFPDGDTRVNWRHQGEIFEDSKQDILQASIVCRNLQELGVDSLEALQFLFPEKTPEERAAMLSGFPFRVTEATQRSIGIFVDTVRALFSVPHPQEPDLPLGADPNLDLVPYLYRTFAHLRKELNYGGRYRNFDPVIGAPSSLDDADRLRASLGLPTAADRRADARRRAFASSAVWGATAGPGSLGMANGVQQSGRRSPYSESPDFNAMGGTLAYDPADPQFRAGGQLGSAGVQLPGGFGAADLAAPTNAGLVSTPGVPVAAGTGTDGAAGGSSRPARRRTGRARKRR